MSKRSIFLVEFLFRGYHFGNLIETNYDDDEKDGNINRKDE